MTATLDTATSEVGDATPVTEHPYVDMWHPDKNTRPIARATSRSTYKVWWVGDCGHDFEQAVRYRLRSVTRSCPACARGIDPARLRTRTAPRAIARNPLASHEAARLWDSERNADLTPAQVSAGSDHKAWWLCPDCDGSWEAMVKNVVKCVNASNDSHGCPHCASRQRAAVTFDQHLYADMWHPTKNEALRANEVGNGSGHRAWFVGDCGHEFHQRVETRTSSAHRLCPRCAHLQRGRGALSTHPYADMWHPDKNDGLDPATTGVRSVREVWWTGDCGHDFLQRIANRTKSQQRTCPSCSSRSRVLKALVEHPYADMWHPDKNPGLDLAQLGVSSDREVWWCGDCGHDFQQAVEVRTRSRLRTCPACSSRGSVGRSLLAEHPYADMWHPTKNQGLDPATTGMRSAHKVWWTGDCGHDFQQAPEVRTRSRLRTCPACSSRGSVGRSLLAEHPYADMWHPTKNEGLDPATTGMRSAHKVWWTGDCGHDFQQAVMSRSRSRHRTCPSCSQRARKWTTSMPLSAHTYADMWHRTRNLTPAPPTVSVHNKQRVWWIGDCGHDFLQRINCRTAATTRLCAPCARRGGRARGNQAS